MQEAVQQIQAACVRTRGQQHAKPAHIPSVDIRNLKYALRAVRGIRPIAHRPRLPQLQNQLGQTPMRVPEDLAESGQPFQLRCEHLWIILD